MSSASPDSGNPSDLTNPSLHRDEPSVARDHPDHARGVMVTALSQRPFAPAVETIDITARELAMAELQDRERFDAAVAEGIDAIPGQITDLACVYARARGNRRLDRGDVNYRVGKLLAELGCEAH